MKARPNTHADVRKRAMEATGRAPSRASVNKTFKKNAAHTAAVKARAAANALAASRRASPDGVHPEATLANSGITRRPDAPATARPRFGPNPSPTAVQRANPNAAFKREGPELTREAVIKRARAAGRKNITSDQVTRTLAASKARALARSAATKTRKRPT